MSQKIVINTTFGGYSLSRKAYAALGLEWDSYGFAYIDNRTAPELVHVVESLGSEASSGRHALLRVVEIPDGVQWTIEDHAGIEHVAEAHRTWS
jgi:hypothetical protein